MSLYLCELIKACHVVFSWQLQIAQACTPRGHSGQGELTCKETDILHMEYTTRSIFCYNNEENAEYAHCVIQLCPIYCNLL